MIVRLTPSLPRAITCALGILCTFLLFGCASSPFPPAPRVAASPDYNYIIGPGDTLNVVVWRNPEISGAWPVRPDGKVTTTLVEDMPAAGRDPTTLAREIERTLSKYIRDPVVTVIVSGFQGPYSQQIRIIGEATHPQAIPYRQEMTALDVMIVVGGLTDFADGNRAILMRAAEGGKQYNVRLKDLIKKGDISANVDMKPGDIVLIPQSWF
jgi:polysaccharide export outer membrane protein